MVLDLDGLTPRALGTFERLDVCLQAEARRLRRPPNNRGGDGVSLPGQLLSQVLQRLRRPPQRRLRVTPLVRLDQPQQHFQRGRVVLLDPLAVTARRTDTTTRQRSGARFQLRHPPTRGGLAHLGRSARRRVHRHVRAAGPPWPGPTSATPMPMAGSDL
ncbi:hypothetical protein Franean1_0554 [Parafrankia sp. EAN1pec]|nr:hypothetical protein Franean1_0554 [Frankia sp. EAN1pec]